MKRKTSGSELKLQPSAKIKFEQKSKRLVNESNWKARPAAISGKGVGMIALQDFQPDDLLWTVFDYSLQKSERLPKQQWPKWTSFQKASFEDYFCEPGGHVLKSTVPLVFDASIFVNHSNHPNALFVNGAINGHVSSVVISIQPIKMGEEILTNFDYSCYPGEHQFLTKIRTKYPFDKNWSKLSPIDMQKAFSGTIKCLESKPCLISVDAKLTPNIAVAFDSIRPISEGHVTYFPIGLLPKNTFVWYLPPMSDMWIAAIKV